MTRGTNTKVWVIILMTVMVLAMFGGIPGIAQEPDLITGVKPTPTVLSPPTEPTPRSVLLTEDFSASWVPCGTGYDAPPGWTVEGISSTRYWSQYDDANTGFPTSNSTPLAAGLWWHWISQDEWLITPQLDFSNYVDCSVTFNSVYTMPSFGAGATAHDYIKVSTNGGSTWDTLGDLCHDPQFEIPGATGGPGGSGFCWYEGFIMNPGEPSPLCIDLGAYDRESSVIIAWNYQCVDNDKSGLHCIDDVHVDGTYSPPPTVDRIEIVPDTLTIVVGDTQQFTATAYDIFNNTIPGAIISWSTDVGVVNSTGLFTAQTTPGTGVVTATSGTASDSAEVTVVCGPLDHIIVIPDPVNVVVGETQAFMAEAHDVFCNVIPGVCFSWTTDIGVIDATGLFTAQTVPGVGIVTATNFTFNGSATVNVVAGPVDHIIVLPDPVTIVSGGIQQFTAIAHDSFCNVIPSVLFTWSTDVGIIDASGILTAMSVPGVGTVTATNGTISGSANVTVIQTFDIDISEAINSNDWILISFPNKVSGDPLLIVQDVLDQGGGLVTWDIITTYNATQGEWLNTATFKPPPLNTFNYVDNFMAFWIHITNYGDGILTVEGELAVSGEQAVIHLKAGWNLVGYPFPNYQGMFGTFGTLFSLTLEGVEMYDSTDPYRLRLADWLSEWHLPGLGYWVHVTMDEDLWMWCP